VKPKDILEEPENGAEFTPEPDGPGTPDTTLGDEKPDLETVMAERDKALAENAELLDRFRRNQADFENARRQILREKQETQEYAAMETIRSLLPVVDDLERALATPGIEPDLHKGLSLIQQQMLDAFTRAGLKPVEHEGKFNPHFHHAVDRGPAESDEQDQDILAVYQKGYLFKDRLLRPAMVRVAIKED
jgi:molecular chaperone GrpE